MQRTLRSERGCSCLRDGRARSSLARVGHEARPCLARVEARHPGRVGHETWTDKTTHLFPSELRNIFEVDATRETYGAIWCVVEDEGDEVRKKSLLSSELVELLFGLFSRCWLERCTQQRRDVRHGHSSEPRSTRRPFCSLFVTSCGLLETVLWPLGRPGTNSRVSQRYVLPTNI